MDKLIANRFELQDLLGRGGMGEVYRATDLKTGEIVAIKILNDEIVSHDPAVLARFQREGQALRQLNHPNIVKMVTAFEENGRYYLVMEFVAGGSLQDLLSSNGKLPHERVVQIALDLADALTRAHRLGIIHRDLKPANVLLAEDGTPRLADFGIAHITTYSPLTQSGIIVGSIDYLSPEACRGEALDERTDIWSFGVLLFQLLSGEKPFKGDSMVARLNAILTQKIPDLSQLAPDAPDALIDLIYRMLENDVQQRIPSVRLVGAELESILKGRGPVTPSRVSSEESRFETPTPSTGAPKHNLPTQPTSFVGRQAELTELARLLNDPSTRLVTILGAGGMGKTRLSIEAGMSQLNNYPNGVYFVPLAPLESIEAILPTTAQAIRFSFYESGDPRQQLLDYLREKNMLLIMDNFEHLLSGVELVSEILNTAPQVKILSTSRARLNLQGEQLFRLSGMDFPDWETPADALEYSAIKLFMQSACRVRLDFELTPDNLKFIARICKLVEGTPLGILLAASWVEILSPEEIAKEIAKSLDFLETEQRDLPERQHSMRAVFDYSWNLLTSNEQDVFKKLSVFRGGFTREAAQRVTDASLRELMALVDKSLLHRAPTGRYSMHELLRQYAQGRLSESNEEKIVRGRHLDHYLSLAEQFDREQSGPSQADWMQRMAVEIENIRAAVAWSIAAGRAQAGLHMALCLLWFWRSTVFSREGKEWLERLLAEAPQPSADRVNAFRRLANFAEDAGDNEHGIALREQALAAADALGDPAVIAEMCSSFASILYGHGDTSRAQQLVTRSLDLSHGRSEIQETAAFSALLMGELAYAANNPARAQELHVQALALYRNLNTPKETAMALMDLGIQTRRRGDLVRARLLHEESVALWHSLDDPLFLGVALDNLGSVLAALGELERSHSILIESLSLLAEMKSGVADWPLLDLALLTHARGQPLRAARLLGAEDALRRPTGRGIQQDMNDAYDRALSSLRSQLGEAAFTSAWAEGAALTQEQAIELALGETETEELPGKDSKA